MLNVVVLTVKCGCLQKDITSQLVSYSYTKTKNYLLSFGVVARCFSHSQCYSQEQAWVL